MHATGPVTLAGKHASSRNSLKHGFSGSGKNLPTALQVDLAPAVAAHELAYRPRNDAERALVRQAALASVRIDHLQVALLAHGDSRVRNALADWDARRAEGVAALHHALLAGDDPEAALRGLRRTAEGCDRLADAWESLIDALGPWPAELADRMLRLLGFAATPLRTDAPGLGPVLDALDALARDADDLDARVLLRDQAAAQRDALVALGDELWRSIDAPDRAEAPRRAQFDPSPEAARLARYLADAERLRRRALDELRRLQAGPASSGSVAPASGPAAAPSWSAPSAASADPATPADPANSAPAPEPEADLGPAIDPETYLPKRTYPTTPAERRKWLDEFALSLGLGDDAPDSSPISTPRPASEACAAA
jgi:hypothetical protein